MNIAYNPADDSVENKNRGEGFGEAKDGTGKISAQQEDIIMAQARRAIELAKVFASRNASMPFTQEALLAKGREYMRLDDATFAAIEQTLNTLPIVNEAALREAHIPDTEKGIVGNRAEGVRDPKASVKSEDVDKSVVGDAKVQSNMLVPQLQVTAGQESPKLAFTTTEGKILAKGGDINKLRLPRYRRQ